MSGPALRRIIVLGCAGAGKTTFARRLARAMGAPHLCLDAMWPGPLQPADVAAFRTLMAEAHAGDAWVSDGNFAKASFEVRAPRADLVVWLQPPRWLCAWRAVRRVFRPGEPHRLRDVGKALAFIRRFERMNRPLIEAELARWAPGIRQVSLSSRAEVEAYIGRLRSAAVLVAE